jgi:hypothetical protein
MPDRIKMAGVPMDPADKIISLLAFTSFIFPFFSNTTVVARLLLSNKT